MWPSSPAHHWLIIILAPVSTAKWCNNLSQLCEISSHGANFFSCWHQHFSLSQHEIPGKIQFPGDHCLNSLIAKENTYLSLEPHSCQDGDNSITEVPVKQDPRGFHKESCLNRYFVYCRLCGSCNLSLSDLTLISIMKIPHVVNRRMARTMCQWNFIDLCCGTSFANACCK